MPKISVHLEADSTEEFLALLGSFKINTSRPVEVDAPPPPAQGEDLSRMYEGVSRIAARIIAEEPAGTPTEPVKPKRGRPFKTAPVEPEPTTVEPTPEPAVDLEAFRKQGEIDAATPLPQSKPAPKPKIVVSRQDLLDAFSEYVQRYGASFGFSDISSLLQKNLGDGVRKASDVPEDKLQVAIGAIKTAIADNPFNRKRDYA